MELKFTVAGKAVIEKYSRAIQKMEREYVKQIGNQIKPVLREAVTFGRALIRTLFGGGGKRFQRAFVQQIRVRGDDLDARLGYVKGRGERRKWYWLGRIYEYGATITSKKGKGLWIPVGTNRGEGGQAIVSARQYFSEYQGRGVVKMSSRGNLVAFRQDGAGLAPMFVIKSSVKVKARPVTTPTAERFLPKIRDAAAVALFDNFKR